MKNKTFARVLSFCLALILCFTWNIAQPLAVNALAVETGWVLYAIISFLAASGFSFAAVGGIDALQAKVDEKVDTYYKTTGIDLIGMLSQEIRLGAPWNNNGRPGLWFTAASVALLREFVEWLYNNGWSEGEVSSESKTFSVNPSVAALSTSAGRNTIFLASDNGNLFCPSPRDETKLYFLDKLGTVIPYPTGFNITYNHTMANVENGGTSLSYELYEGDLAAVMYRADGSFSQALRLEAMCNNAGYTLEDFYGLTFISTQGTNLAYDHRCVVAVPIFNDGNIIKSGFTILKSKTSSTGYFLQTDTQTATITSPEKITEFDVEENEGVEINFDIFNVPETIQTPQELTEAVKQQIIDTGTFPTVQTEIKTETNPNPTPSPVVPDTPIEPSPEEIPDVGELGLPSLGLALTKKFPFCLPYDIAKVINIFIAERQTPKWEIEFPDPIPVSFEIDLTDYEELGSILRWTTTIGYCLFLILSTKKFMSW